AAARSSTFPRSPASDGARCHISRITPPRRALNHMTRVIARQYAAKKIRCNVILLGMMDTPHIRTYYRNLPPDEVAKIMRQRDSHCPMGRQGTAWDAAHGRSFSPPMKRNTSPALN